MDQKKVLTIIPLIFFSAIVALIAFLYVSYKVDTNGCIGFHRLSDGGIGINFQIECDWEVNLNTDLEEDTYSIHLIQDESNIVLDAIVKDESIGEVDITKTDYEVTSLENNLIRFREKSASEYYYADSFPCEKAKEKTCTNYLLNSFSTKYNIKLKAIPNGGKIEEIDRSVERLLTPIIIEETE